MTAMTTRAARQEPIQSGRGVATLTRPRFSPGLLLQDDDLTAGVDHARQLSRLLFRHLFGCGVVCGLTVAARHERDGDCLHVDINPGLALDCEGDPVQVPSMHSVTIRRECGDPLPQVLWVVLRRTEQCCLSRARACPPEDGASDSVPTRLRDGYEIALLPERPEEACGCEEENATDAAGQASAVGAAQRENCYKDHEDGTCAGCCSGCGWVLLAKVFFEEGKLYVLHAVRRFIRPALLKDPRLADEPKTG